MVEIMEASSSTTTKIMATVNERPMKGTDVIVVPEEINPASSLSSTTTDTTASVASSESSCTLGSATELSQLDEVLVEKLGGAMAAIAMQGDISAVEISCFEGSSGKAPAISLRSYLHRMLKYIDGASGSSSWTMLSAGARALICAIIYIDRLTATTGIIVNSSRIHRLLATGILVALKMNEDAIVDMNFFASLAGVEFREMKKLESEFLRLLKWDTLISETDFQNRIASFERFTSAKSLKKKTVRKMNRTGARLTTAAV
jgi:hypothetical protein